MTIKLLILTGFSVLLMSAVAAQAQTSNTAYGFNALVAPTGSENSAFGDSALERDGSGSDNTASGFAALTTNTTGNDNTASGAFALNINMGGSYNTATGVNALEANKSGNYNTATGFQALYGLAELSLDVSPAYNTGTGAHALYYNAGSYNTANGGRALYTNSTGAGNTATGYSALKYNDTGSNLTADGAFALFYNTTGLSNTACGYGALNNNKTGSNNIALGELAGYNLTSGNGNIDIGNQGVAGESGKIRLGTKGSQTAAFIAGIYGKTVASGVGVVINSNGLLGTVQSSARFKEAIQPMAKASEALLMLEPVTFRYKQELDPDGVCQFGLIAEQVEKVNPDLIVRDEEGKVMTVRYEAVNAMLLNEFLKEHQKVAEQQQSIEMLQQRVASDIARASKQETMINAQHKRIEALAAGLERVSARVEASQPSTKLVNAK